MIMELFYKANMVANDESITFSSEESRHLSKVLRKKVGEMIIVTNGEGLEWKGQIVSNDVRKATAKKQMSFFTQTHSSPSTLLLLLPKATTVWNGFSKKRLR